MFSVKKLFPSCGRQKTAIWGSLVLSLGLYLFGIAGLIQSKKAFVVLSLIARLCQGLGSSLEQTAFSALLGQIYKNNRQKITVFLLLGQALGNASGPVISGFLINWVGYSFLFIIMGIVAFLKTALYFCYQQPKRSDITAPTRFGKATCTLLKHCLTLCSFLNAFFSISYLVCYEPILSSQLTSQFNLGSRQSALYFFFYSLTGTLLAFLLSMIPQSYNKRPLLLLGNVVVGIGLFLSGPSKMLHLPNKASLILGGMVISRLGNSFAYAFVFAESWTCSYKSYPNPTQELLDYVSGLVTIMFGLAMVITPLASSSLTEWLGFRTTMDIFGISSLIFFLFYLVTSLVHQARQRKNQGNMEDLEESRPLNEPDK